MAAWVIFGQRAQAFNFVGCGYRAGACNSRDHNAHYNYILTVAVVVLD